MANKSSKKSKKPLQTTLGRAASNSGEKIDLSNVQKPIYTSVVGISELVNLRERGTQEVINYIENECDLIYECRVCRTLFRSLANFILHKREYCHEQFSAAFQYPGCSHQESKILHISDENSTPKINSPRKCGEKSSHLKGGGTLDSVINKLKEKHDVEEHMKKVINEDLSGTNEENPKILQHNKDHDLLVEQIGNNNVAVFQTLVNSVSGKDLSKGENMKSQVMEIHTIMGKDEAVLGPDGKLFTVQATDKAATASKTDLVCPDCKLKFATRKTLTYHIKYKHNKTRRVFICPDCKGHFANAWSVYRHLYKIHRRTAGYIKRVREQINNSVISKEIAPAKKKEKDESEKVDSTDEENQWLNNIEGDKDFQMCGGCGKRFERKAALHSHAQMCIKRIAVCNSIKENSAKRKEEETKDKIKVNKVDRVCSSEPAEAPKGASKRKPYLLRTYKKPGDMFAVKTEAEKTSDVCDVNANSKIVEIDCDISSGIVRNPAFIKNEANTPDCEESNSPDANLNTSDHLENFRGFNREVNVTKMKSETDEDPDLVNKFFWNKFGELCSLQTSHNGNDKITAPDFGKSEINLPPDINGEGGKRKTSVGDDNKEDYATSSGKISIRTIEDLTGISPIKKKSKAGNIESTVRTPQRRLNILKEFESSRYEIIEEDAVSESIKANVSPKMLKSKIRRPSKRKRSISYDTSAMKSNRKILDNDSLAKEQDFNFVQKASPFMDKKNLICKHCKKTYPTFAKLLWHMSGHFSWFRFQCSRCSFISFSKSDCSQHAKASHCTNRKDLQSVVLPIPNWKIALMSHDFRDINEENDLTGKHTDEVILDDCDKDDEVKVEEENKESTTKTDQSDDEDIKIIRTLFVDTDGNEDSLSGIPKFPLPMMDVDFQIKNELTEVEEERRDDVIDIIEDTNESFLIEDVPQEIYSPDSFEMIPCTMDDGESTHCSVQSHNSDDDLYAKYLIPKTKDIEIILVDDIKREITDHSDEETNEIKLNGSGNEAEEHDNDDDKMEPPNYPEPFVNTRPTRNRTRSIKTRNDDFFYELNKALTPNEIPSSKTNGNQKVKKGPAVVCQKPKTFSPKSTKVT